MQIIKTWDNLTVSSQKFQHGLKNSICINNSNNFCLVLSIPIQMLLNWFLNRPTHIFGYILMVFIMKNAVMIRTSITCMKECDTVSSSHQLILKHSQGVWTCIAVHSILYTKIINFWSITLLVCKGWWLPPQAGVSH